MGLRQAVVQMRQTCDWKISRSTTWTDHKNVGGKSEAIYPKLNKYYPLLQTVDMSETINFKLSVKKKKIYIFQQYLNNGLKT